MNIKTKQRSNPRRGIGTEELAYVEMVRTADLLSRRVAEVLKLEDLSAAQYNVLRILRGASEGLACREIADRMLTRDPDITRLLDRLEKRRLIARSREAVDRRQVSTRITRKGLNTLARLDRPVKYAHRKQLRHLGPKRLRSLLNLLRKAQLRVI